MSRVGEVAELSDRTIEVLRADAVIPAEFAELAGWISRTYGVNVLNVTLDSIRVAHEALDRIIVWFRTQAEADAFRRDRNFDPAKQSAIAEHAGRPGILVVFSDIDRDLREVAVQAVGQGRWASLVDLLPDPAIVWKIESFMARVTVFLHTEVQVSAFRGTPEHERLDDAIWGLIHENDEFAIIPRESFAAVIDSKQNYDENFEGNGYYYYR